MSNPPSPKRYREDEEVDADTIAMPAPAMKWKRFLERPRVTSLLHRTLIKALEVIDCELLYKIEESPDLVENPSEHQMIADLQNGHNGEGLEVTYDQQDFSPYAGDADYNGQLKIGKLVPRAYPLPG